MFFKSSLDNRASKTPESKALHLPYAERKAGKNLWLWVLSDINIYVHTNRI